MEVLRFGSRADEVEKWHVEDRYGELARIVGLFSGRGYNIDSLAVNQSLEPGMSRVVLTTRGDAQVVEQILKQVNKLVRVHKVRHLSPRRPQPCRRRRRRGPRCRDGCSIVFSLFLFSV